MKKELFLVGLILVFLIGGVLGSCVQIMAPASSSEIYDSDCVVKSCYEGTSSLAEGYYDEGFCNLVYQSNCDCQEGYTDCSSDYISRKGNFEELFSYEIYNLQKNKDKCDACDGKFSTTNCGDYSDQENCEAHYRVLEDKSVYDCKWRLVDGENKCIYTKTEIDSTGDSTTTYFHPCDPTKTKVCPESSCTVDGEILSENGFCYKCSKDSSNCWVKTLRDCGSNLDGNGDGCPNICTAGEIKSSMEEKYKIDGTYLGTEKVCSECDKFSTGCYDWKTVTCPELDCDSPVSVLVTANFDLIVKDNEKYTIDSDEIIIGKYLYFSDGTSRYVTGPEISKWAFEEDKLKLSVRIGPLCSGDENLFEVNSIITRRDSIKTEASVLDKVDSGSFEGMSCEQIKEGDFIYLDCSKEIELGDYLGQQIKVFAEIKKNEGLSEVYRIGSDAFVVVPNRDYYILALDSEGYNYIDEESVDFSDQVKKFYLLSKYNDDFNLARVPIILGTATLDKQFSLDTDDPAEVSEELWMEIMNKFSELDLPFHSEDLLAIGGVSRGMVRDLNTAIILLAGGSENVYAHEAGHALAGYYDEYSNYAGNPIPDCCIATKNCDYFGGTFPEFDSNLNAICEPLLKMTLNGQICCVSQYAISVLGNNCYSAYQMMDDEISSEFIYNYPESKVENLGKYSPTHCAGKRMWNSLIDSNSEDANYHSIMGDGYQEKVLYPDSALGSCCASSYGDTIDSILSKGLKEVENGL